MTDNTNLTVDKLQQAKREIDKQKAALPKYYVDYPENPQGDMFRIEKTLYSPAYYVINPDDLFFMQIGMAILGLPLLKHVREWIPPPLELEKFTPTWTRSGVKDEVWKWKWRF